MAARAFLFAVGAIAVAPGAIELNRSGERGEAPLGLAPAESSPLDSASSCS
jgi:hypothetical protein